MGRRLRPASLYPRRGASVVVPLALVGLPDEIDALGERWQRKDEFHVTAVDPSWAARRAGVPEERAAREIEAALEGRRVGPVRVGDELRLVRDGGERTLVVMVRVDGLAGLFEEISGRLGAPLPPPPAHITLYTRPGGKGIGVHDETELRERSRPLGGRESAEVRDAAGLDALFG